MSVNITIMDENGQPRSLQWFLNQKPLTHQDTGEGTTFRTLYPGAPFKLIELRFLAASALAAGETLSLTRTCNRPDYADYLDYTIYSNDIGTAGILSVAVIFDEEEAMFTKWDTVVPALSANVGADRWGLEIVYKLLTG